MAAVARDILAKEGAAGFYRGLAPVLVRAFPANAACFLVRMSPRPPLPLLLPVFLSATPCVPALDKVLGLGEEGEHHSWRPQMSRHGALWHLAAAQINANMEARTRLCAYALKLNEGDVGLVRGRGK